MQHTARLRIEANRDQPDTVVLYRMPDQVGHDGQVGHDNTSLPAATGNLERRTAHHTPAVQAVRAKTRRRESFRFDPNTVSIEDLQRLGFSEKQAQSIDNYRQKGGRFRRKEDFAKSYVVADSVYRRLEPFIDIPRLDINKADSAAFDALPGIGPFFAAKMVSYREDLGGYSTPEQLLEIYNFGEERYEKLKDLIECSDPPRPLRLWTLPEDSLKLHPHIRYKSVAHGIVLYRDNNPSSEWTLEGLLKAGVLDTLNYASLRLCRISPPVP
ncbi:MAG: helix-hairpin-helix domain-containing protein [Bacteroidales bacterium]|nr:helix-hairpin-helix domain-containing protein [Bacteroidales bacterium]